MNPRKHTQKTKDKIGTARKEFFYLDYVKDAIKRGVICKESMIWGEAAFRSRREELGRMKQGRTIAGTQIPKTVIYSPCLDPDHFFSRGKKDFTAS